MSTSVTPSATTTTSTITASKVLVKGISDMLTLQNKVENKFSTLAELLRKEADAGKLDAKGARLLLESAYKAASGLEGDALTIFLAKKAPDRSKIMTLAFPKTPEAAAELEKAKESDLGLNWQFEIARGNITAEEAALKKAAGEKPNGREARPTSGVAATQTPANTQTTPQAAAQAAKVAGLTPKEKFLNQIAALVALGTELKLTLDEQSDLIGEYYAERSAEASK